MLDQVFENTMKLMNGLKTLNSNIKKYIGKITEQKTSEEIMKHHFQDYAQDVIDKGYHRLKTSDNVSKFRPKILERLEEIKSIFGFYPQRFIDNKSLYIATEGKKSFESQKLNTDNIVSDEERERRIKEIQEKKKRSLSKRNIDTYVFNVLGDRNVIKASDLPLENRADFIKLIYIVVYSKSRLVHYKVKKLDKPVEIKGFIFNDFEVWRK